MVSWTLLATRMMSVMSTSDPWAEVPADASQLLGRRVGGAHPLSLYWVRNSHGAPGLLIRGIDRAAVPQALPRPRGMSIVQGAASETPEAALYLLVPRDKEVFLALCLDVIAYSAKGESARAATGRAFRRIEHWHSLLSRRAPDEMAPQEIRGLIGELWVLLRISDRIGMDAAIQTWVAPDDHPQDFALSASIVEVKTRLSGSRPHVRISSLEQLEDGAQPLRLVAVELTPSECDAARSLNEIARQVMDTAEAVNLGTGDRAAQALLHRGYMEREAYGVDRYTTVGARGFRVEEGFPRITRSVTDRRITAASYALDLTALAAFECALDDVLPEHGE